MSTQRSLGAISGAVLAGAALSVLLIRGERQSGRPSELIDLGRSTMRRLGRDVPVADRLPSGVEQVNVQAAHLALSAIAGAAYAATTREEARVLTSGALFGLGFYGLAHWLAGPLLGLKPPEWRSGRSVIAAHAVNHVLFGLVTAAAARLARARSAA